MQIHRRLHISPRDCTLTARHHRKPHRRTTAPRRSSHIRVKPAPKLAEPLPYSSQTPARSPLEIASRHARFSEVSHIKRAADHSPMQPHITHITKTHRASRRCERSPRIGRPCRWRRHSISLPGRAGNRPIAGGAHHLEHVRSRPRLRASGASDLLFSSVGRNLGHTLGQLDIILGAH